MPETGITKHYSRLNAVLCEKKGKTDACSQLHQDGEQNINSLILLRTLLYEEFLDESERGVHVSFEGITNEDEQPIILKEIILEPKAIHINTAQHSFQLDLSKIEKSEIQEMRELLIKQNYDNSFSVKGM